MVRALDIDSKSVVWVRWRRAIWRAFDRTKCKSSTDRHAGRQALSGRLDALSAPWAEDGRRRGTAARKPSYYTGRPAYKLGLGRDIRSQPATQNESLVALKDGKM